jgi:hypothetical protein
MEHIFAVYQSRDQGVHALRIYMCLDTPSTSDYIREFQKWIDEVDDDEAAAPADSPVVIDDTLRYLTGHWDAKRPPADLPPCLWPVDPINMDWSSQHIDSRFVRLGGENIKSVTFIQGVEASEKEDAEDEERQMSKDDWRAFKAARAAKRPAAASPDEEPDAKRQRLE